METKVRICLIDDDQLFIRGMQNLFEEDPNIELLSDLNPTTFLGDAYLPPEELANRFKKEALQHTYLADIVLVDLRFRNLDMSGLDLAHWILDMQREKRIVILSSTVDGYCGYQALHQLHLAGYLIKGSSFPDLRRDIMRVAYGSVVASQEIHEAVYIYRQANNLPVGLTRRQHEVLDLLVQDLGAREIAERLNITQHVVQDHIKNLKEKLNVRKNTGLVREAILRNLVDVSRFKPNA